MIITDVAIIGAGPAGIFAVFELGMLGIKCAVLDALPHIGGQCTALYPEKLIYDIPAYKSITAGELIDNLASQAEQFSPVYILGSAVVALNKDENGTYIIKNERGEIVACKAVIIAAGAGAFGPNRPPLKGIEEFEGKSVFYSVARKSIFAGKKIMIAGGGDSSIDWANSLAEIADQVYLVHRREKFRAFAASLDVLNGLVAQGKVKLVVPYQLASLQGAEGGLESVTVVDLESNEKTFTVDYLLPFFGLRMELGPILDWGLAVEKHHIPVASHSMETNLPGIFAIGDIASYPGKLKLILSGFAEAATAAHATYNYVFPGKALHFEYSTTKLSN